MSFFKLIREFAAIYVVVGLAATVSSKLVGRWHGQWSDIFLTALVGALLLMIFMRVIDKIPQMPGKNRSKLKG